MYNVNEIRIGIMQVLISNMRGGISEDFGIGMSLVQNGGYLLK